MKEETLVVITKYHTIDNSCNWLFPVMTSGVMIPFFPGTGIISESLPKEPELELHGFGSKVESVPHLESIPRAELIPFVEPVPVLN